MCRISGVAMALLVLLAIVAPSIALASNTVTVTVNDDYYDPEFIAITVGDSVVWQWQGAFHHSTTSDAVPAGASNWNSPIQVTGSFGPLVFTVTGDYHYYCMVHGQAMSGMIHVKPAPAATLTSLNSSSNPSILGQPVALVAIVTSSASIPIGTVVFDDGSTSLGSMALDAQGSAVLTVSVLSVGTHSIQAAYQASQMFLGSTSTVVSQVVNKATPTVSLTSSADPSILGGPVTLAVKVSSGAGVPSGTVALTEGAISLASISLDGIGSGVFTTSSLLVGTHLMTATYAGDANFVGAFTTLSQVVDPAPSSMVILSSVNPVLFGQMTTFTATVTSSAGGTPTGTVTFSDGGASLGTAQSLSAGTAMLMSSLSAVTGLHTIQATYSGDANHAGTTAQSIEVVNSPLQTATAISVQGSVSPPLPHQTAGTLQALQRLTLVATLIAANNAHPSVGTILFVDGSQVLGMGIADPSGQTTLGPQALAPGSHTIVAIYSGDSTFGGSVSTVLVEVRTPRPR